MKKFFLMFSLNMLLLVDFSTSVFAHEKQAVDEDENLVSNTYTTAPSINRNGNSTTCELYIKYSGPDIATKLSIPKVIIYNSSGTVSYGASNNSVRTTIYTTQSGTLVYFSIPSSISIPVSVTSAKAIASGSIYIYSITQDDFILTDYYAYAVPIN